MRSNMSILSQQNKHTHMMRNPFIAIDQPPFSAAASSDQFPRYHAVEIPTTFNIWPPTPKLIDNDKPAHEHSLIYMLPEDYSTSAFPWDASVLGLSDTQSLDFQNIGIAQEFDSPIEECAWNEPRGDYSNVLHDFDGDRTRLVSSSSSSTDCSIRGASRYSFQSQSEFDSDSFSLVTNGSRRISDASTSLLSQGHPVPNPKQGFGDFSHSYDGSTLPIDYTRGEFMGGSSLSPVVSPRPTSRTPIRAGNRGRSSPSPRPRIRAAPYSVDSPRDKRWSTGSYYSTNGNSSYLTPTDSLKPDAHHSHGSGSACGSTYPHPHPQSLSCHASSQFLGHGLTGLGAGMRRNYSGFSSIIHPLFKGILASSVDSHHNHYADLSDPPDLYASLYEEQLPPPPEDMNPEDPDMKPHEQDLRFEGDLYTPRWVRNHGNKREGWCGICKPGRWLVLKNSAFWYDKSFTHGISAATGQQFAEPKEVRRMDGNPDVWEGLCHSCNDWVALVSNKKKGTTWFRHAYKCHTHPKIKDAPKRKRETSQSKSAACAR